MSAKESPAAGGAVAGLGNSTCPPQVAEVGSQRATAGERTAVAVAFAPGGSRARWLLVVTDCPFGCGQVHVHLGAEPVATRRAGCRAGRYRLDAADTVEWRPLEQPSPDPARAAELAIAHLREATGHDVSWVFDPPDTVFQDVS